MSRAEALRLEQDAARTHNWKRWGPYLSERQWGTVREDYSAGGDCWSYFPHDHARSRAYRWGEDGLLGICDRQARLCFALALWNERDPILKERLFGLNGHEGNHGEDVKELYYYLDSSPTHSYMRALYKYPQGAFPYERLVRQNRSRGRHEPELELSDCGAFEGGSYFDVQAEYAKAGPDDILIRIRIRNRGRQRRPLRFLPTLWFRNTWSWNCGHEGCAPRPSLQRRDGSWLRARHPTLGGFGFLWERPPAELLLTHNETNTRRLYGIPSGSVLVKDAFHGHVIGRPVPELASVESGTKAALHYRLEIGPGAEEEFRFRLRAQAGDSSPESPFGPASFGRVFERRIRESGDYYRSVVPGRPGGGRGADLPAGLRPGCCGPSSFYHYVVEAWLEGDPGHAPPPGRRRGRNRQWTHLHARDVLSMPDKWEYPWFAAWDLAFHCIPLARVDPAFAKSQLILMLREWYLHPNGQLPAYEFRLRGRQPPGARLGGLAGLQDHRGAGRDGTGSSWRAPSQKLLLNFTWWVNRKDLEGNNLFGGGFLGLDNIGPFDRSRPFPGGGVLTQADGTAWMAFYCLTMLAMALELARGERRIHGAYSDMASKFFEHFVQISDAFNHLDGTGLWDREDGFYYDRLAQGEEHTVIRIRSLVGLLPLIAVEVLDLEAIRSLPGFHRRFEWFCENRRDLSRHLEFDGAGGRLMLMLSTRERLERTLRYLADESEFLSSHGNPLPLAPPPGPSLPLPPSPRRGARQRVRRPLHPGGVGTPASSAATPTGEAPSGSPVNYLLIEALERYHHFYGDSLKTPLASERGPHGSTAAAWPRRSASASSPSSASAPGAAVPATERSPSTAGRGPWEDLVLFHEYFDGDSARGLGASHQTGWTALVARLLEDQEGCAGS